MHPVMRPDIILVNEKFIPASKQPGPYHWWWKSRVSTTHGRSTATLTGLQLCSKPG